MGDPGLPPKPRCLNLLQSLVKEEEERSRGQGHGSILLPLVTSDSSQSLSPETTLDSRQPKSENNTIGGSYTEFKMKDIKENAKVKKVNSNPGFKGKLKRRSRSKSPEPSKEESKRKFRPFSAGHKFDKREKIMSRPATSKSVYRRSRSSSLEDSQNKEERHESVQSYSSDSYSSDEEYVKKEKYRSKVINAGLDPGQREKDDFFDSEMNVTNEDSFFGADEDNKYIANGNHVNRSPRQERSRSPGNLDNDQSKPSLSKVLKNSHPLKSSMKNGASKSVHINENVQQRTRSASVSSEDDKMIVVDDYSSSFSSSSSDEESHSQKSDNKKGSKANEAGPTKSRKSKTKKLLNRKKVPNIKTFQISPDEAMEAKVQQKYIELQELMSCQIVKQKSNMTRHQMYQMELLRNQYKSVSHGLPHSSVIIPRSLPEEMRQKTQQKTQRPLSGRRSNRPESDQDSLDYAYGTIRSVMAAEQARKTDTIRTDIVANRPPSAKHRVKKKKLEASLKAKPEPQTASKERHKSESEDEPSEKPSVASSARTDSSREPQVANAKPSIDHHVKYSKNDKLKQWLKEKDRIYRKQTKAEKAKKREERDTLINDANDRIEKHLESQKLVKKWMHEKNKELFQKQKEEKKRLKLEKEERNRMELKLPGDSMKIRPQSAPPERMLNGNDKFQGHADGSTHPPQAKFIYKRPVAGKIKFAMKDKPKQPAPAATDSGGEKIQLQGVRMSYDGWLVKKRQDDIDKKKERDEERRKEMAKSDPELNRILPNLAKNRVEQKLNQRKRIDTGIKSHDGKANRSFGGADFDGDSKKEKVPDRPRSAYRLESDRKSSDGPALTVKQMKRPQTAPAVRTKPPHPVPKKSVNSPRQAVVPVKADQIMANNDETNPFMLPFPPEKGAPKHVAARQRKIFADQINERLGEIERAAARNVGLVDDGIDNHVEVGGNLQLDDIESKMESDNKEQENVEPEKKALITEIMYSPKRVDDSSSESSEENVTDKELGMNTRQTAESNVNETVQERSGSEHGKISDSKEYEMQKEKVDAYIEDIIHENIGWKSKTVDNLHEITVDAAPGEQRTEDLKLDIEKLKERVESLKMGPPLFDLRKTSTDDRTVNDTYESQMTYEGSSKMEDMGPPLVGILKESRTIDITVHMEDKDTLASNKEMELDKNNDEEIAEELDLPSPREDSPSPNAKHVSFIEEVEVFESYESSSTETITPEQPNSVNASTDGLDAQPDFDDVRNLSDPDGLQRETMPINVAGFVLHPSVVQNEDEIGRDTDEHFFEGTQSTDNDTATGEMPAFLTDPDIFYLSDK